MRNLILVFGDQLDLQLSALEDLDPLQDDVAMAELDQEATRVPSHKSRLVFFFAAMRHFRVELMERGVHVHYHALTADPANDLGPNFTALLTHWVKELQPRRLVVTEPGDWHVRREIELACARLSLPLEIREDRHFFCSVETFREWAGSRRTLVLDHFYRLMRKLNHILLDDERKPLGGAWNFDRENRRNFGRRGPGEVPPIPRFPPDTLTQTVIDVVRQRYAQHPGELDDFAYPVTHAEAREALTDFVAHRLPKFGLYQDAMWSDQEVLYHSQLSPLLNAHLLNPRVVLGAAISALEAGRAPLPSVEGFVRQILGWREFVRGVYWTQMPQYAERNELGCSDRNVPDAFWTGESELNCVRQAMRGVLTHGYAHHIQRLMVLGLYAQLLGVHPRKFHDWHMAMYVDAVDWVSLPNTLGMSQHADGGLVGTKPYCATGSYVNRMSDYCRNCRFNPRKAMGDDACPLTTMYWDFLNRHRAKFADNRRMSLQLKNLDAKSDDELAAIAVQAAQYRAQAGGTD